MRYTLSDVRSSPVALAIFALGVAAFLFAVLLGDPGSYGAPVGTPRWWLGLGFAGFAIVLSVRSWLWSE